MNFRIRFAALGVTAVMFTATMLWAATIAGAQPKQQATTIRYAYFKAFDPTFVAIEKGFFKQAGVDVVLTGNYPSGPSTVQGGGFGQVDAGLCSISGISLARASGIDVRGIADVQTEFAAAPLERFYVKSDSPYRGVKDLKGKKVAVNGFGASFYYTWIVALRNAGMSKDDVSFINMPFAQQEQALLTGQVDAIGLIDPFSRKMELDGGARRIFRGIDVLGSRHISLIWFTTSFMRDHNAAVKAYVAAYRKAVNWIYSNPRGAAGIMWKYLDVEPRYATYHRYTQGASVRMIQVQWWIDLLRDLGDLKDGGKLTAASVATVRYTGVPGKH